MTTTRSTFLNPRSLAVFAHDVVAAAAAWWIAFLLRFNFDIPAEHYALFRATVGWTVLTQAALFWPLGLYRGIWRFASLPDLRRILVAVGVAALAVPTVLVLLRGANPVPRSVFVLSPILLLLIMGGSRIAYRAWKERYVITLEKLHAKPVLILGGDNATLSLIKELAHSREWQVVGLLDDNALRHGREIGGVRILGPIDTLGSQAERLGVEHAIIAMPDADHAQRRRAATICADAGIKALTVPAFDDLMSGKVTVSQLRRVEVDDLLGRDPVRLDASGLSHWIGGQVVMVTGAGGSIGSELCRQIARYAPRAIVLYEASEFALYTIEQEFAAQPGGVQIVCVLGDVKDADCLDATMARWQPAVVFHAAAYKHVPMVETGNAWAGVRNNVLGTLRTARAAIDHGVAKFVLVSTDKAVNPTSVMGTSKRLAEMVCQGLQREGRTRFVMVRFGNVLGSTGSVIPTFRKQIAAGGPVTVTHPEMTRYFMSIPEAAQLVLQAGLMGEGGEIFVLDMGEPVRIVELAREMIRLSGLGEDDIRIVFTGLRPGEKLFEELLADGEATLPTPHPKLRIARSRDVPDSYVDAMGAWLDGARTRSDDEVREALRGWVPEYRPGGPDTAPLPAAADAR
jgi:FlaA1/EpsC-like NDP-sugar epimerase